MLRTSSAIKSATGQRDRVPAAIALASCLLSACGTGADSTPRRNQPPVAALAVTSIECTEPLTVHFDASASHDADGSVVSYRWSPWGPQGSSVNLTQPAYGPVIYGAGAQSVELSVADDRGARGTAALTLKVAPLPHDERSARVATSVPGNAGSAIVDH